MHLKSPAFYLAVECILWEVGGFLFFSLLPAHLPTPPGPAPLAPLLLKYVTLPSLSTALGSEESEKRKREIGHPAMPVLCYAMQCDRTQDTGQAKIAKERE